MDTNSQTLQQRLTTERPNFIIKGDATSRIAEIRHALTHIEEYIRLDKLEYVNYSDALLMYLDREIDNLFEGEDSDPIPWDELEGILGMDDLVLLLEEHYLEDVDPDEDLYLIVDTLTAGLLVSGANRNSGGRTYIGTFSEKYYKEIKGLSPEDKTLLRTRGEKIKNNFDSVVDYRKILLVTVLTKLGFFEEYKGTI